MTFTAVQIKIIDDEYSKLTIKLHIYLMNNIRMWRKRYKTFMDDLNEKIFMNLMLNILKEGKDNLKSHLSLGSKKCDICNADAMYFCCSLSYCDSDFRVHAERCQYLGVEV